MAIFRFVRKLWSWLNKHKVISGFVVTMAGVYVAFLLMGIGEQKTLDRGTEQRLHLAILESQYNGTIAKEIIDNYAKTNVLNINVNRLNSTAATIAFQDSNVLSFLPHYKVSLLRSYIDAINTLNQALEMHQGVLESSGYQQTSAENDIRNNVRSNAASVFAMAFVLQKELNEYVENKLYDRDKMNEIEDRVKLIKEKALKGEISLSKEE